LSPSRARSGWAAKAGLSLIVHSNGIRRFARAEIAGPIFLEGKLGEICRVLAGLRDDFLKKMKLPRNVLEIFAQKEVYETSIQ
jgi:hypothetical protein